MTSLYQHCHGATTNDGCVVIEGTSATARIPTWMFLKLDPKGLPLGPQEEEFLRSIRRNPAEFRLFMVSVDGCNWLAKPWFMDGIFKMARESSLTSKDEECERCEYKVDWLSPPAPRTSTRLPAP